MLPALRKEGQFKKENEVIDPLSTDLLQHWVGIGASQIRHAGWPLNAPILLDYRP